MTGKKKRTVYCETLIKPFQNQERTKMVAEAIEPSVTLDSIALKINQGLEELTATDLKELQSIAVHDINHEVRTATDLNAITVQEHALLLWGCRFRHSLFTHSAK